MNITQVKIFPVEEEKLKAFVSIVFDHCFMVNDIKVIQGKDGLFLSMPSRRKKSGEFKDVAHPLNNETRRRSKRRCSQEYRSRWTTRRRAVPIARATTMPTPWLQRHTSAVRMDPVAPEAPPAVARAESAPASEAKPKPQSWSRPAAAESVQEKSQLDEATEEGDRSLEEVQEEHLRDSFWTVS